MATCAHCGERKGKRSCPALGASICPQCCGEHRRGAIQCPVSCSWLGGLTVVSGELSIDPELAKAAYVKAVGDLDHWASVNQTLGYGTRMGDALFGDDDPGDDDYWLVPIMMATLLHGVRDDEGLRLIDHYLAERAGALRPAEAAAVVALAGAWASVFSIERVDLDESITLRDLADDTLLEVREKRYSHQAKEGDRIFAWILAFGPWLELTGGLVDIPKLHHASVTDAFLEAVREAKARSPGKTHRELSTEICDVAPRVLRRRVHESREPIERPH